MNTVTTVWVVNVNTETNMLSSFIPHDPLVNYVCDFMSLNRNQRFPW